MAHFNGANASQQAHVLCFGAWRHVDRAALRVIPGVWTQVCTAGHSRASADGRLRVVRSGVLRRWGLYELPRRQAHSIRRGAPRAQTSAHEARHMDAQSGWRSFTSRSLRSPSRPRTSWASCTVTCAQTTCSSRPLGALRDSGAGRAHRCCRHLRLADFGLCTPAADPTQPRQRVTQPVMPLRVLRC
jgi:hypothetical protein